VVGSSHPTNSFVMYGSSAQGMVYELNSNQMLALRCASITAPSIGYSSVIDGDYEKRKNHRMLLSTNPVPLPSWVHEENE